MSSGISSTKILDSYSLFNAADVKSYIISELSKSDNPVFSGCSYMGSNMNALIDIISLIS
ncbi:MAG: hypothetical protein J6R59_02725 [Paludibacteraceae bacterium]|nr:hypothetical protein [Paludibacteraceae bacterium]